MVSLHLSNSVFLVSANETKLPIQNAQVEDRKIGIESTPIDNIAAFEISALADL